MIVDIVCTLHPLTVGSEAYTRNSRKRQMRQTLWVFHWFITVEEAFFWPDLSMLAPASDRRRWSSFDEASWCWTLARKTIWCRECGHWLHTPTSFTREQTRKAWRLCLRHIFHESTISPWNITIPSPCFYRRSWRWDPYFQTDPYDPKCQKWFDDIHGYPQSILLKYPPHLVLALG